MTTGEYHVPTSPGQLKTMDDAMDRASGARQDQAADLDAIRQAFVEAVLAHITQADTTSDAIASIFDHRLAKTQRRFVALSLVRLLATNRDVVAGNTSFWQSTFKLLDEVLGAELYPVIKLKPEAQTYEKQSVLVESVRKAHDLMTSSVAQLDSLHSVAQAQQGFLRAVGNQLVRAMILPFIPRTLWDKATLERLFAAVREYAESEGNARLQALRKCRDVLQPYIGQATDASQYTTIYFLQTATRLQSLVNTDFDRSPLSQPAKLELRISDKRYPFSLIGAALHVGFAVHNQGPGPALNAVLEVQLPDSLAKSPTVRELGDLAPLETVGLVQVPCKVTKPPQNPKALAIVQWGNFDGSKRLDWREFDLKPQRTDVPWEQLETAEPYALEPVTDEREFVGRAELLSQLIARIRAPAMGSSFLYGQRRVGKTSIVKTLASTLTSPPIPDLAVTYVESGDYVTHDATTTINALGRILASAVLSSDPRLGHLPVPEFDGALAPLAGLLLQVARIIPNYRALFILDEFDELPPALYRRTPSGDALFQTIRSISNKRPFAFILVGGEKMEIIQSTQGDTLNKFTSTRLDYFDRERDWADFQELVRRPVEKWLDVTDGAIAYLYEQTAGNPFFTKLICRELFRQMVQRRDSHVTDAEMREAVRLALAAAGANIFMHFWEDRILDAGAVIEERSIERRRVLIALGEALRRAGDVTEEGLVQEADRLGVPGPTVKREVRDFEERQILVRRGGSCYEPKMKFFRDWLKERGVKEIITTLTDADEIARRKAAEEAARVTAQEVEDLASKWGSYRGRSVGPEQIRSWLEQFGSPVDQRLMFKLLTHLRFYSGSLVRELFAAAHKRVQRTLAARDVAQKIEAGQRRRRDILVSYLDGMGKSGSYYAKVYAQENEIFHERVVEQGRLRSALESEPRPNALILVDDFIGSGTSATECFQRFSHELAAVIKASAVDVHYITIAGFGQGQGELERRLSELDVLVHVYVCDPLDRSDMCFSDESTIYPSSAERERAKELAIHYGAALEREWSLGYAGLEAAVAFEWSIPNNSLPVLWKRGRNWSPLFERL